MILRDAEGTEVATDTGPSGTLHVPNVHKWAPGDGYLYDLEISLVRGDTVVVEIDEEGGRMLLHVIDASDPAAVVAAQLEAYERVQRRVFP